MRDSRRSLVYSVEDDVAKHLARWKQIVRFKDHKAVEQFLEQIYAHPVFQETYPIAAAIPIIVRQRKSSMYAHYEEGTHTMALHNSKRRRDAWALSNDTILHECAHHCDLEWVGDTASHGAEFREVLCNLYTWFISPEAGELLRTSFREAKLAC